MSKNFISYNSLRNNRDYNNITTVDKLIYFLMYYRELHKDEPVSVCIYMKDVYTITTNSFNEKLVKWLSVISKEVIKSFKHCLGPVTTELSFDKNSGMFHLLSYSDKNTHFLDVYDEMYTKDEIGEFLSFIKSNHLFFSVTDSLHNTMFIE